METALAALAGEGDIDLEETNLQEILLACKESRQLRGRTAGEPRLQARDRAHQWTETTAS